jgi:16S rRNA (guanine966-N2)-methyltransferase
MTADIDRQEAQTDRQEAQTDRQEARTDRQEASSGRPDTRDNMASNEVRIIGGKWRGRKIVFPNRRDLRPTLGRVRETLFNWLRTEVVDSRCLDLFAGSGALGFEAASRGAAAVTLVESDRRAVRCLGDNAARLGADNVIVICLPAERMLRRHPGPWDIIFVDPPFQTLAVAAVLEAIVAASALAPDGLVYVEASGHDTLSLAGWREVKHGRAGDTQFGLLARA